MVLGNPEVLSDQAGHGPAVALTGKVENRCRPMAFHSSRSLVSRDGFTLPLYGPRVDTANVLSGRPEHWVGVELCHLRGGSNDLPDFPPGHNVTGPELPEGPRLDFMRA